MSSFLLIAALLQGPVDGCGQQAWDLLTAAAERRRTSGVTEAASELARTVRVSPHCVPLRVASWAMSGWLAARAAAAKGGSPESLGPAKVALDVLAGLMSRPSWRVQNDYARAAVTAAMAASQDERPEMRVYLSHARALSERLMLAGERTEWPLPIDELEGELWLEVDHYAEARTAYEHAVQRGAGASALIGLARVSIRLNDARGACDAYRRTVAEGDGQLAAEAREYLDRSTCGP